MEGIGPILVTGGGAPGAPGILKALLQAYPNERIFSCDVQEETIGKILAHESFTVPSGDSQDYITTLIAKCTQYGVKKILPITTKEIANLAERQALFQEQGIDIVISTPKAIATANNKGTLYQKLKDNKLAVPDFRIAKNYAEALAAVDYFQQKEKPYITKPCIGNGSRGFRILDAQISKSELLFHRKPTSTYTSSNELLAALAEAHFSPILLSEYMPGQEYTVDCLVHCGEPLLIIPRSRLKMNAGISVAGQIVYDEEIIAYCESILRLFQFHGPIGIQVKRNTEGKPLIVEINPRIQGTTVACTGAGVDIAALSLMEQPPIPRLNDYPIKWGTKFIRHYVEEYYT